MNSSSQQFDELYKHLNDAQRQAVDIIEGPVVVNAGPGTGKTQILTLRIANILRQQGADMADNILALTFTNAGVVAMRQRLAGIIGSDAYRVGIFTFHSFAESVIKQHSEYFGDLLQSTAATDVERYDVVSQVIMSDKYPVLKPFAVPLYNVPSIVSAIDQLKRDNVSPDDFARWNEQYKDELLADHDNKDVYYQRKFKDKNKGDLKPDALKKYEKNLELVEIYRQYQKQLRDRELYDFNDMIVYCISAIESNSQLQYELQEQYQYLLVDEHQDSNNSQNRIVELLLDSEHLDGRPNIFTVGDDKQAIYRFQGASLENFLSFENKYQDVQVINLTENYRSGQQVLDSSHSLIQHDSGDRKHQVLRAQRNDSQIENHSFRDYRDELDWVAKEIQSLHAQGVPWSDIAVMYRENRHTVDIRQALARHQVPSVVFAKENILESPLVYKILLLLQVAYDLADNRSLTQLLYSNVFDTNTYDVVKIIERFRRNKRDKYTGNKHLFRVISDEKILSDIDVNHVDVFVSLAQVLQMASSLFASDSFLYAFDQLMQQSGMMQYIISHPDSAHLLAQYDRWYQELRTLSESNPRLTIGDVLAHVETINSHNLTLDSNPPADSDAVHLLTAHKSKGLEYPYVFITNVVDKVWGNKTRRDQFVLPVGSSRGDNDDERRLLYVGITRAEQRCVLSHALAQGGKDTSPSQFLFDMDTDVVSQHQHTESVELSQLYQPVDQTVLSTSLFSDELVQQLFNKRPLSVTALNNFMDCPARYFVNNLMQIPASYSRSLVYGSLMHCSLELFFSQSAQSGSILDKQTLLDIYQQELQSTYLDEHEQQDMLRKGLDSLGGYYDTYSNEWNSQVQTEMRINGVQLALETDTVTLTGVLDKVEFDTDNPQLIRVVDYKTGKTYGEKTKEQKEALDRQIAFYALLLGLYRDGHYQMSSGVLDFVEPNKKTRQYEAHSLSPDAAAQEKLIADIQYMRDQVMAGISFLDNRCGKKDCDACVLLKNIL